MTNNSNTQIFRHLYFLFIFLYFLNVRNDCKTLLFFSYNFTIDVIYREPYYVTIISLNLLYLKKVTLKPSEKKAKYQYGGLNSGRPVTPPRTANPPKKR